MTVTEKEILNLISAANGIKASDIAVALNMDYNAVKSILYSSESLKPFISINPQNYKWYAVQEKAVENFVPTDTYLSRICNYYLNCLSLESGNSVSQMLRGEKEPKYVPLNSFSVSTDDNPGAAVLLKRTHENRDLRAYLGYPVRIYTAVDKNGSRYKRIAPVFLFPVEYSGGVVSTSRIPSINMEVLKCFCDNNKDALVIELIRLENELGLNSPDFDAEIDELVLRLKQVRQWDWAEPIDPYAVPESTDFSELGEGIYNRPVLIETEKERYTHGLESELVALSNMPEESYEDTALYSWIKGQKSDRDSAKIKPVLEVLPLNLEQATAVETALTSDLTIVTGPPGTGKSQVVTDLLVNIAWNGKNALFSSKNNKAVDVVDLRVNGLSKRPVLLRIGSNQCASRLAEIIEGLLSVHPDDTDKELVKVYLSEYERINSEIASIKNEKEVYIQNRNRLDEAEQKYCPYRDVIGNRFSNADESDVGKITPSAESLRRALFLSVKKNNGFFSRLFWSGTKKKRIAALTQCVENYNVYASKYNLKRASVEMTSDEAEVICKGALPFDAALSAYFEYKKALSVIDGSVSLENLDKKLTDWKKKSAHIASVLWDKWLTSKSVSFTGPQRLEMTDYVSSIKLAEDADLSYGSELSRKFAKVSKKMTEYLQCWAVTSLSVKGRVPFKPGYFDYVIIDEASQCDIASIIPLLFRAKRAVIIGDPKQLSHIAQIPKKQDISLLKRYDLPQRWSYSSNSLYDLAVGLVNEDSIVSLRDHFRSCSEIIDFSNNTFYGGSLRTATDYSKLTVPNGEKPGVRWVDVHGRTVRPNTGGAYNLEEARRVVSELKRLIESGYSGTVGVTTPFRLQAEKIRTILEKQEPGLYRVLSLEHEFIADTVHKFQGDERDIMFFSPVVTDSAPQTTLGFLNVTGNLFNVAVTRARAVLTVVGDLNYCFNCPVSYLKQFAKYCDTLSGNRPESPQTYSAADERNYPWVDNPEQVSDWERMFYGALFDAGIKVIPQYHADRYRLDFALILADGRKLDIEIDGEMYHRNWDGELLYRDQIRNQRLFELGWDVKRFWVYQIRDETSICIAQINNWIQNNV